MTDVLGFDLPDEIVRLAADERWTAYVEGDRLPVSIVEAVFGERPDRSWKFYPVDEIRQASEEWHREEDPSWFGVAADIIVPKQSVLIGELGFDRPIALDYSAGAPVVRFMTLDGRWVKVADSAADLVAALEID